MSEDRKNDKELKDEELDKVSGGTNADAKGVRTGGGPHADVKKPPAPGYP